MNNLPRVKYSGEIELFGDKLKCRVLESGERVFEINAFKKILGFYDEVGKAFSVCAICEKDMWSFVKLIKEQNPKVFEALLIELSKGLKLVCEYCEDNRLIMPSKLK